MSDFSEWNFMLFSKHNHSFQISAKSIKPFRYGLFKVILSAVVAYEYNTLLCKRNYNKYN